MSIEEFYKDNKVDEDFDYIFYQKTYPETKGFYQPHCFQNQITEQKRLFYHWKIHGETTGYFKSAESFHFDPVVSSRAKVNNKLAIITSFFNPCNYTTTKYNYCKFSENIKYFADLYSVELSFDDNFFIKDKNCIHIHGGKENILWQKEALLNIVLDNLPKYYTDVAWIDCDIIFNDKYWVQRLIDGLNSYKILHLFNDVLKLNPNGNQCCHSSVEAYCNIERKFLGEFGYAWAGRREVLDEIKLLDNQILGGADQVMAYSFMNMEIPNFKKDQYINDDETKKWSNKANNIVQSSISYINNQITHLYHGDMEDRKYETRYKIINELRDKAVKESNNIWSINNNHITDTIQNYFQSRNEDKNLVNLNQYFDKIYIVNLKDDEKKLKKFKHKINKLDLTYELFNAVDGESLEFDLPEYAMTNEYEQGCLLSHLTIIKQAQENNYSRILIFEDDVKFAENFLVHVQKLNIIKQWKLIYLGGSQHDWSYIKYIDDFYYAKDTCGTFAYGIDCSIYSEILHRHKDNPTLTIDTILRHIQNKHTEECYVFYPNLCSASVSESKIRNSRDQCLHDKKMKWDLINYE